MEAFARTRRPMPPASLAIAPNSRWPRQSCFSWLGATHADRDLLVPKSAAVVLADGHAQRRANVPQLGAYGETQ
jgi:hypothetical protein